MQLHLEPVRTCLSMFKLAGTSEAEKNMRYANSLESLDAVASSIQQARAYSLSYHNNGYGGKMATSVTSSKGSIESDLQYSSTSTSRQNGNFFVR